MKTVVELKEIAKDNLDDVLKLKVSEKQIGFFPQLLIPWLKDLTV